MQWLPKKAQAFKEAGLTRVNVSLDSLHEDVFTQLIRRQFLGNVLGGVEEARAVGLGQVKINAVLTRGVDDQEAPELLEWALSRNFELCFIEQMPLDAAPAERFEVRRRNTASGEASGTVLGTVGIIASVSEAFCSDCRRTNITAEGKIMSCLSHGRSLTSWDYCEAARTTTNWCAYGGLLQFTAGRSWLPELLPPYAR